LENPSLEYLAFLSYAHEDRDFAAALHRALEAFAKSWNVPRRSRVFRDDANLAASHDLAASLHKAISSSGHFLLLASPDSSASPWVRKELETFVAGGTRDRILIVLVRGHLTWDEGAGDFQRDDRSAFPLLGERIFAAEPLYIDLTWCTDPRKLTLRDPRFLNVVAALLAAMTGISKDRLSGDHLKEYRQQRRRQIFNLAFRGAFGFGSGVFLTWYLMRWTPRLLGRYADWVADQSYLGHTISAYLAWLLALPVAGALGGVACGLKARGAFGFALAYALLGPLYLFSCFQPFQENTRDVIGFFVLGTVGLALAGALGAKLAGAPRAALGALSFGAAGLLMSVFFRLAPGYRREAIEYVLFTGPWLGDRLSLALRAMTEFNRSGGGGAIFFPIPLGSALLGALIGMFIALAQMPRQGLEVEAPARGAGRRRWGWTAAAVLGVFLLAGLLYASSPSRQMRVVVRELRAPVLRSYFPDIAVLGEQVPEAFRIVLKTRNDLREAGFAAEASEMDGLMAEWVSRVSDELSWGANAHLPEIAAALAGPGRTAGDRAALDRLLQAASQRAGSDPRARIGVAQAMIRSGDSVGGGALLSQVFAERASLGCTDDLWRLAETLREAERGEDEKAVLVQALEHRESLLLPSPPGKTDFDCLKVVAKSLARDRDWDHAGPILESLKTLSGGFENTVLAMADVALGADDFAGAFKVLEVLEASTRREEHHPLERAEILYRIGSRALARKEERSTALALEKAEKLLQGDAKEDEYEEQTALRVLRLLIEAGKLREARSGVAAIDGTFEAADALVDLARAERVRGQRASAARSLRAAWLILHRDALGEPQCTTLARISGELVAQGDLKGARSVAEECDFPWSDAKSDYLERVAAFDVILAAHVRRERLRLPRRG
jgi:thioredoxin-like negative regulator of GroEL